MIKPRRRIEKISGLARTSLVCFFLSEGKAHQSRSWQIPESFRLDHFSSPDYNLTKWTGQAVYTWFLVFLFSFSAICVYTQIERNKYILLSIARKDIVIFVSWKRGKKTDIVRGRTECSKRSIPGFAIDQLTASFDIWRYSMASNADRWVFYFSMSALRYIRTENNNSHEGKSESSYLTSSYSEKQRICSMIITSMRRTTRRNAGHLEWDSEENKERQVEPEILQPIRWRPFFHQ